MKPPRDLKWLHNVNAPSRKSREKPRRVYDIGTPGPGHAELMRRLPDNLGDAGRAAYVAAASAPWLSPLHHPMIVAYADALDRLTTASQGLDRAMLDPAFATPKSEAHEAGKLYARMVHRLERQCLDMARALGLTPKSRAQMGIALVE